MPQLPTVAIIGRPNTGKSRLFNRLIGRRKAIVSDTAGTTRDHIAGRVEADISFLLVDTGGMGGGTEDVDLEDDVHEQSVLALEHADIILLTINSQEDMTSGDYEIVEILRKNKKKHVPVILVPTKCDNPLEIEAIMPQYYELGIADEIVCVSAPHKIGIDDLKEKIQEQLEALHFEKSEVPAKEDTDPATAIPKIAIIGKPNVGKSSIINAFMSEKQREKSPLLVSDIAGTTRDSTDTSITYHEQEYIFADTAGIKRKKQTDEGVETHAYFRSIKALEESEIVVLVIDASEPMSKQDKRIASIAVEEGKGLVILANKIDQLEGKDRELALAHIRSELQFCSFAEVLPCSAETKENLLKLFDIIEAVQRNRIRRIATNDLHRWLEETVYGQPMQSLINTKHITQADEVPPTFILFCKDPKKIQVSQLRFLDNQLRKTFAFEGTPVRWITKQG